VAARPAPCLVLQFTIGCACSRPVAWVPLPQAAPNTHVVTAYVSEHIFSGEAAILNERVQQACLRIVDATKRWSQEITFRLGAGFKDELSLTTGMTSYGFQPASLNASPNTDKANSIGGANSVTGLSYDRTSLNASPNTDFETLHRMANATTGLQVMRFSMEAA